MLVAKNRISATPSEKSSILSIVSLSEEYVLFERNSLCLIFSLINLVSLSPHGSDNLLSARTVLELTS